MSSDICPFMRTFRFFNSLRGASIKEKIYRSAKRIENRRVTLFRKEEKSLSAWHCKTGEEKNARDPFSVGHAKEKGIWFSRLRLANTFL
jgi:hypothetical protein